MDYTSLITSQHRDKPRFVAVVDLLANSVGTIADTALSLTTLFDVDFALGVQLDTIGIWVGVSRRLDVPLDVFFSWDTTGLGWDQGQWNGAHQAGTTTVLLDDETYRLLMKTIIKANHWDGTLVQYQTIMQTFFPTQIFYAVDNQNMTMDTYIDGEALANVPLAIMQSGPLSKIKPAGVGVNFDTTYDFGFDEAGDTEGFGKGTFNT